MALTVGSLFSGIGGLDLGLERAGMEVRWQVEIDDFCRRVLAKHWPDVPRYGDIKELTGHELEPVVLICGGFPCQPVSLAGKRLGQDDERWLWPEFVRIVRVVRPRFVLVENVPGLLVRGLGDVLGDLAASGYDAEWDCVPAGAVGAPQIRDRVWILAYAQEQPVGTGLRTSRPSGVRRGRSGDGRCEVLPQPFQPRLEGPVVTVMAGAHHGRPNPYLAGSSRWDATPRVCRAVDGVSDRMERLRALGNAVVPQVAEYIGRRIVAIGS